MSKLCSKRKKNYFQKEDLTILPRLFSHSVRPELSLLPQPLMNGLTDVHHYTSKRFHSYAFNSLHRISAPRRLREKNICKSNSSSCSLIIHIAPITLLAKEIFSSPPPSLKLTWEHSHELEQLPWEGSPAYRNKCYLQLGQRRVLGGKS